MKVKHLTEILWKVYDKGRPKATDQTIREADIGQMVLLCYGSIMRKRYYESKKNNKFNETDYSFISPVLDVKEFKLSEPNTIGMRRAAMNEFDLVRMPYNDHITNIYPIGGTCGSDEVGKISLVRNGEEKYYSKPKFKEFLFAVIVGRGLNVYNLPICVDKIGVETTYSSDEIDVTFDIGFEISLAVFQILWKEKLFPVKVIDNSMDPNVTEIKRRLTEQQDSP